jgi:hypothetical protein
MLRLLLPYLKFITMASRKVASEKYHKIILMNFWLGGKLALLWVKKTGSPRLIASGSRFGYQLKWARPTLDFSTA